MPYAFTLTASIPPTPEEIYEAWLDSLAHSEMTGGEANIWNVIPRVHAGGMAVGAEGKKPRKRQGIARVARGRRFA